MGIKELAEKYFATWNACAASFGDDHHGGAGSVAALFTADGSLRDWDVEANGNGALLRRQEAEVNALLSQTH